MCTYQLRTFDGEISCRLGQRSQPGLIPGREARRSVRVQFVQGSQPRFNSLGIRSHEIGPGSIRARELCLERLGSLFSISLRLGHSVEA